MGDWGVVDLQMLRGFCRCDWKLGVLGIVFSWAMGGWVAAQVPVGPEFDPSEVYFQAYMDIRAAEQLEKDEDFPAALRKYEQAAGLIGVVGKFYPEWKPTMVKNRLEITEKAMGGIREKAGEQIQKDNRVIAELEGGEKVGGELIDEKEAEKVEDKGILEVDALQDRRLKEAEAEVARLREKIAEAEAGQVDAARRAGEAEARQADAARRAKEEEAKRLQAMQQAREAEEMKKAALERAAEEQAKREQMAKEAMSLEQRKEQERREAQAAADAAAAEAKKQIAEAAAKAAEEAAAKAKKEVEEQTAKMRDANGNEAMRNESRVEDLRKQNESLQRKLKAAEDVVRAQRAEMAKAPVRSELDGLNKRIEHLEQERDAVGMALNMSREEHTKAMAKVELLNADVNALKKQAEELRQKEANLERDLKVERKVANDVVAGQRKQMEKLEKALEEKTLELKGANQQIAGLKQELEEVRESFAELREERDLLLQERDQMAALLKLNDGARIEPLIEQNMGLAKQLREANEKVERLNLDSNAAKDDLVDAKRDLAIAKSMINRLQHDNREQDKRIEDLKKMLESEEKALAGGEVKADAGEVQVLREVIRKQLRMQERRRQAKELLVEAARDLGKEDERLNDAIELFDIGEIELTPEEQKLVANQHVDGEFVSPVLKDRETVGRATNELNREIDSYDRAARKAYLAGRLMPTRELYELVLEEHPGHVPALCKLGVVHLKLNEPGEAAMSFQKAIELDEGNAYAMRMLGYTYMKMDDMASADTFLRKAVDLAPDDSKGHLMLGMVAFRMGQMDDAEGHFKGAITADPLSNDAYFNLAMVYVKKGKMNEARKAYSDALERGAVPDQALEKQFK